MIHPCDKDLFAVSDQKLEGLLDAVECVDQSLQGP